MNIFRLFEVEKIQESSFQDIQTLNIPPDIFYAHFLSVDESHGFYISDKNMNEGKYV